MHVAMIYVQRGHQFDSILTMLSHYKMFILVLEVSLQQQEISYSFYNAP